MNITLITGASSGLGKEFAKLYAKDGNNLLITGTNSERLEIVKNEILTEHSDLTVDSYICDLSDEKQLKQFIEYVKLKGYFVNNLINCAGFGDQKEFLDMDIDFQVKMVKVNSIVPMVLMRTFLPEMVEKNEGSILNVASIAGLYPGPYMCTYHSTKAFLVNLSEAVSYEIRNTKIKYLTFCPGPFKSAFVEKAHNDYIFKNTKPLEAYEVAKLGYTKLNKGKRFYIVGAGNRFEYFVSRFVGRNFVLKSSAKTIVEGGKGKI